MRLLQFLLASLRLLGRMLWLLPADRLRRRRPPVANSSKPLIILYSQVAWQGVWQRPQELAVGLARRGWRVLYVAPMQIHEQLGRYAGARVVERPAFAPGVEVFSPAIFSGEYRWAPIFRLNKKIIAAELRRGLRDELPTPLFANTPLAEFLLRELDRTKLIYDVMDDFSAFDWAPAGAEAMERRLLREADVVFTGTYTLLEKVRPLRPDATFVPCGVDFDLFHRNAGVSPAEEPEDLRGLPRPLIGYAGTLSERIDSAILRDLAQAFPQCSIVLIGPVYRVMGPPPQAPNLHYLGLKPHAELGRYLRQFSIGLLPFRLTQAALAINPVKLLEYLAAGCVVISTAIPDVMRFYADVALIAGSREEFVAKTSEALQSDNTRRIEQGIERARACSWEAMVETMAKGFE